MKNPWIAAVLSLFCPGLGQLYANRPVRAVIFLLVPLLLTLAMIGLVAMEPSTFVLALLAMLLLAAPVFFLYVVIDAWRVARQAPVDEASRWWQHPLVYALVFVVGLAYPIVSAGFLRAEVIEAYKIPTMSMAPTIVVGDRIVVRKWGWGSEDVRQGDLVVFLPPGEEDRAFVKRVAGLPGDRVERRDGTKLTVPPRHLWVTGDNVRNSRDSRHFGAVPFENLVGLVTYRYWPPSRVGTLPDRLDGAAEPEGVASSVGTTRLRANETAAIATLRNIGAAQAHFHATGKVDRDGDGVGEYGGFLELSGAAAGRMASPLAPPVLSSHFQQVSEDGEFHRSGYAFRMFLAGPAGSDGSAPGVPESLPDGYGAGDRVVDADLGETTWCCYAWPLENSRTGRRTFFTNQQGDTFACDVEAYSGSGHGPAADAAFREAGSITSAVDLEGPGQSPAGAIWLPVR